MADSDASQAGSTPADTGPIARPDVDSRPAGSMGPASGNTITGSGTVTGQTGADTPGAGGASVVEVHGAGGATSGGAGNFQASGQYGVLSMDAQGNYNYVRNPGTPDGVRDVFQYTLADAQGANAASTLTIDIGQVLTANAGIVNLPSGVELSDIHVVGRDLVAEGEHQHQSGEGDQPGRDQPDDELRVERLRPPARIGRHAHPRQPSAKANSS